MSAPVRPAPDLDVLSLHRALVGIPSVSHEEAALADWVEELLAGLGGTVERMGDNVVARAGAGPRLMLVSHLDTVPPSETWSRDPWDVTVEDGKVHGLGANDAKASVAAMIDAYRRVAREGGPCEVTLLLSPEEETGGKGVEWAWPRLRERGRLPAGVVVGEPTGLELAVAQKGMLVLRLVTEGDACHAAHAARLGARNAVRALARELVALEAVDLGPPHPLLGATTLEPTVTRGGSARNQVPDSAEAFLDCRTVPGLTHQDVAARVRAALREGRIEPHSERLEPRECPPEARVLAAARRARPAARCFGSATMSDMVWFTDVPALKVGPGESERSHRADEFVLEDEVLAGAEFYHRLVEAFATEPSP